MQTWMMRGTLALAALSVFGCGHYYHGYYPGAVALDAPTVVVGSETESPYVLAVVTGTASGTWTVENGWSGGVQVAERTALSADASCSLPRIGASVDVTGNGVGLSGLVGPGIHVACGACSTETVITTTTVASASGVMVGTSGAPVVGGASGGVDTIAALALLSSLSSISLGGDAVIASQDGVLLEASLAHDAMPIDGGESAIVVRALGGPPAPSPTPVRVHLVIDTSASMEARWDEVRDAALALIGRLREGDELEIVVYSTGARVALAPTRVGDGTAARAVIRGLTCSGQTNIEAGLRAAYGSLAPAGGSIVLLLSDGVPEGGYATPAELGALAAEARVRAGATTVTIGLGSEFHAGILRSIARRGGGDFRIAPTAHELGALLEAELAAHTNIAARDVSFSLELASGVSLAASLDLTSLDAAVEVQGGRVTVHLGTLSANEARTIVLPIVVASPPGPIASVSAHATCTTGSADGQRSLTLRQAPQPIPAGGLAATLDADLASALASAATGVENGDASGSAAAMRAHAELARTVASGDPAITLRVDHTLAFAAGIEASVPGASWGARRRASAAMLEWSVGLGR